VKKTRQNKRLEPGSDSIRTDKALDHQTSEVRTHRAGVASGDGSLILVATLGGPTMFARIGVIRALNRDVDRVFNPDRKDTNWGKRKFKRDE
jgi:hypothetical protein